MSGLKSGIEALHPERIDVSSAWLGHLPFAFWVIEAVQPRRLVELGTHSGVSYCAFCQALDHLSLSCECHAIDTWEGDDHTGAYPSQVYFDLKAHHDPRYGAFSELARTTFDAACDKFADGSIDLLHIDGLHTYGAVRHDFELWRPKLSDRAVVLFHDINVMERDFGVQRLWRELCEEYPNFSFSHSHGLGVLGVGEQQPPAMRWLFKAGKKKALRIRQHFARLAQPLQEKAELLALRAELEEQLEEARHDKRMAGEHLEAVEQARETLVEEIGELHAGRAKLQNTLDLQLARAQQLEAASAELQAKQQEAFAKLQAKYEQLNDEHATLLEERNALRGHAEQLAGDIAEITQSSSWRWTAPLRRVSGGARNALQGDSTTSAIVRGLRQPGGLRKAVGAVRQRGLRASVARIRQQAASARALQNSPAGRSLYADWIAQFDTRSAADREAIEKHMLQFRQPPLFSVVMPVYNTQLRYLRECIMSVQAQLYPRWELCIADDCSPDPAVRKELEDLAKGDDRIKLCLRQENGGIAAATNSALELASGEFVVLLDHDDLLPDHALYWLAAELQTHPDTDLIYSDEDKIDAEGQRYGPHFKGDYNYELLLAQNCISHLGVYRRTLLQRLGGIREGFEGSQDHDLALRFVELIRPERIRHIPTVLYHWRVFAESGSFSTDNEAKAVDSGRKAIEEHLERVNATGVRVTKAPAGGYHLVRWPLAEPAPTVEVIVPSRDNARLLQQCVQGLLERTDYPGLQVTVVDNGSRDAEAVALLRKLRELEGVRVLEYDYPFNYSAINNFAVARGDAEFVCLLNDDIDVIHPDWLQVMVGFADRAGIGAVGARLLYEDDRVQHGGVVLGIHGVANHFHKELPVTEPGYFGRLQIPHEVSAVTAACLVVRRSIWEKVGGLNESDLGVAFNDVDFCLRLREAGYRNLFTPLATLYHLESVSRGSDLTDTNVDRFHSEVDYMLQRWDGVLQADPFYSPNLSLDGVEMNLAWPPRVVQPWARWKASRD